MGNQDKNNNQNNNEQPENINDLDLIEIKTPWWKWPLKIAGYVLTGGAGVLLGLLLGRSDDDDDDDKSDEESETTDN